MQTNPENSTSKTISGPRNKSLPSGLPIALGLILGVAAGVATGHLLWISLVGVLLGGIVEIFNATILKKRA